MGTRATVHVQRKGKTLVSIYRQYDGYPSGLGSEILSHLKGCDILNGFNKHKSPAFFNGVECLGAYLVGMLKLCPYNKAFGESNPIGNVYLTAADDRQEFNYFINYPGGAFEAGVLHLKVTDYKNDVLYSGPLDAYEPTDGEDA